MSCDFALLWLSISILPAVVASLQTIQGKSTDLGWFNQSQLQGESYRLKYNPYTIFVVNSIN